METEEINIDLGPAARNVVEPGLLSPEPLGEPFLVSFGRVAGNILFWVFLSLGITFAINLAVYLCK